MTGMVTGFLTPTQAIVVVLVAMVLLVVVAGMLETRTPERGQRQGPTRRTATARRVSVNADEPGDNSSAPPGPPTATTMRPAGILAGGAPATSGTGPGTAGSAAGVAGSAAPGVRATPVGPALPAAAEVPALTEHTRSAPHDRGTRGSGGAATTPEEETTRAEPETTLARVDRSGAAAVELGPPGTDREVAAVLFAAYVAARRPESARVTGWVTPIDTPPSLAELRPGASMRGRPGKVVALLRCSDEDRNWVALDESTDIGLGLSRRPPADECLRAIVWWWDLAEGGVDRIPADETAELATALGALVPSFKRHPLAPVVKGLAHVAADAARIGAPLKVQTLTVADFRRRRRTSGGSGRDDDQASGGTGTDAAMAG